MRATGSLGGWGGGQLRPVKPWGVGQVIELSRKPLNTLFHPTASEQMAMRPKVPPPSPSPAYCVPGSRTPTKVPRGHGVQAESQQDVLCALQTRALACVAEHVTAATHPGLLWGSRWEHQQVSEQREDRDRRPGPAACAPRSAPRPAALWEEALARLLATAPRGPRDAASPGPCARAAEAPSCCRSQLLTAHNCVETPFPRPSPATF